MTSEELIFVTVEPRDSHFKAFVSVEGLMAINGDPEAALQKAAELYESAIINMRSLIAGIETHRAHRKPVPARIVWKLGDAIFQLRNQLEALSLQLDDVYAHLVRDLCMKRKWLEKVIILRRYLPREDLIPQSLNWGRLEKGTRRLAEKLRGGLPL
jgi:hypothetical protein